MLGLLSEQAVSLEAKERALRIRPETDWEDVQRLLDQTDAARIYHFCIGCNRCLSRGAGNGDRVILPPL